MNKILNQEREGFAITFEIICTMLLIAAISSLTIYFVQVMELERYFADVTSSTCSMASRYGGSESMAYKIQVSQRSGGGNGVGKANIQDNANYQLAYVNSKYRAIYNANVLEPVNGKYITVSNYPDENGNVRVSLNYRIGGCSWGKLVNVMAGPATINQTFDMPSLMQRGKLVSG